MEIKKLINIGMAGLIIGSSYSVFADTRQINTTAHIDNYGDDGFHGEAHYINAPVGTPVTIKAGAFTRCNTSHAYCSASIEIYPGVNTPYISVSGYGGSNQSQTTTIISEGVIVLYVEAMVGYFGISENGGFCAPNHLSHQQYSQYYSEWLNYIYGAEPQWQSPAFPDLIDCESAGNIPDAAGASTDVLVTW